MPPAGEGTPMKNFFFFALWLTVAIAAFMLGQPMITYVIGVLALIAIYSEVSLSKNSSPAPRQSTISRALATGTTGSHRHDWLRLL